MVEPLIRAGGLGTIDLLSIKRVAPRTKREGGHFKERKRATDSGTRTYTHTHTQTVSSIRWAGPDSERHPQRQTGTANEKRAEDEHGDPL